MSRHILFPSCSYQKRKRRHYPQFPASTCRRSSSRRSSRTRRPRRRSPTPGPSRGPSSRRGRTTRCPSPGTTGLTGSRGPPSGSSATGRCSPVPSGVKVKVASRTRSIGGSSGAVTVETTSGRVKCGSSSRWTPISR